MREIRRLIIHCADTPNGRVTTAREIDRWHAARSDMSQRLEEDILTFAPQYPYCGYHAVILTDGTLVQTRAEPEKGSHCAGFNSDSIGVCLIGNDRFSKEQWSQLIWYVADVERRYGQIIVEGHRVHNTEKTCPGFDVDAWLSGGMAIPADHLL